ncbi:MAG: prefoldin subunit alpha [Candidatus Parvarchaeota archaeon]|jgi:prefoldin alpha subunit|nr:prefoldin subunit alpha [Candidatus Parvarchaeota archaeon]
METNEEEINKRLLEIEYLRRDLENYINALNELQSAQDSLNRSLLGLDGIKDANEVYVPYSQEIFLKANITNSSSALVSIGSGVFKEYSFDELKKKLEKDLKEMGDNIEKIAQVIQALQAKGEILEEEATKLYTQYQAGLK